jgi:hypothetical protein
MASIEIQERWFGSSACGRDFDLATGLRRFARLFPGGEQPRKRYIAQYLGTIRLEREIRDTQEVIGADNDELAWLGIGAHTLVQQRDVHTVSDREGRGPKRRRGEEARPAVIAPSTIAVTFQTCSPACYIWSIEPVHEASFILSNLETCLHEARCSRMAPNCSTPSFLSLSLNGV